MDLLSSAGPNQKGTEVHHVVSQQWPMAAAVCMEESARGQKPKWVWIEPEEPIGSMGTILLIKLLSVRGILFT